MSILLVLFVLRRLGVALPTPPQSLFRLSLNGRALALSVVLMGWAAPAAAQPGLPYAEWEEYRDPATALRMAVMLPGGGHLYAGESRTGIALLTVYVGAPIAGMAAMMRSEREVCDERSCYQEADPVPLLVGGGVMLAAWLYSAVDAPRAAERANRERSSRGRAKAEPLLALGPAGERVAGLRLRFAL